MHEQTLWAHFVVMLLGAWCLSAPSILGYVEPGNWGVDLDRVMSERELAPPEWRAAALAWSDRASGLILLASGALSLSRRHRWAQWVSCAAGFWLLCAPLLFWSPDAASYANGTLVGALVIAFAILVPMMSGMSMEAMQAKEDIPPGWSYSPSAWSQRLPIIALALVGFFIARYLAAYQMGHISSVWDPFFDDGTARVIGSDVSRAWPVADAGLGALSYLLEALSGMMGDRRRWRTMPWMVAMFGVLVVPLGSVSIFFIVIQPIVIGTWCTLCLVSAAAMVLMLPYTFDELVATGQFLASARRAGRRMIGVFWHGGTMAGGSCDRGPPLSVERAALASEFNEIRALPKALVVSATLGLWLMFTRLTFGTEGALADSDHLVGSLVFTVSVCALAETVRPLRILNAVLGTWLAASPWLLSGGNAMASAGDLIVGALLVLLSLPRGPVRRSYGNWDRYLVW